MKYILKRTPYHSSTVNMNLIKKHYRFTLSNDIVNLQMNKLNKIKVPPHHKCDRNQLVILLIKTFQKTVTLIKQVRK